MRPSQFIAETGKKGVKTMLKQTFVVTLVVPAPFESCFPRVEAEHMAFIIRDAVRAITRSRVGPVPFNVEVSSYDDVASAGGEIGQYMYGHPSEFDGIPPELAMHQAY